MPDELTVDMPDGIVKCSLQMQQDFRGCTQVMLNISALIGAWVKNLAIKETICGQDHRAPL